MRLKMIYYLLGLILVTFLPSLPALELSIIFTFLLLFLWRFLGSISFVILGLCWGLIWSAWQLEHRLDASELKTDWQVKGQVVSIVDSSKLSQSFLFKVDEILSKDKVELYSYAPRLLKLNWHKPSLALAAGQYLELEVRLKPARATANPEAYDYELWLLAQGIDARGYVRKFIAFKPDEFSMLYSARQKLFNIIKVRYTNADTQALVAAIILGYKGLFTEQHWQKLQATGTIHLAVISGLHMGFLALICWYLCAALSAFIAPLYRANIKLIVTLTITFIYLMLSGFALATERAFIMLAILLLAEWRYSYVDIWLRWLLALVVVLSLSPVAIQQPGLWLSFSAVAVLIWLLGLKTKDWLGWRIQLGLFLGLLPLLCIFFGGFSLTAPLVNLIAIPWMALNLALSLLDLSLSALGIDWLAPVVDQLLAWFWQALSYAYSWQTELVPISSVSFLTVLFAGLAVFLLLQPASLGLRILGLFCFLPLFFAAPSQSKDMYEAWVFDVGQGTAILVRVDNKYLLYDTGPSFFTGGNSLSFAVLPYLKSLAIKELDLLILSHNDNDHVGGLNKLSEHYSFKKVMTGSKQLVKQNNYQLCQAGQRWNWNSVDFEILAGGQGLDNDSSCVLSITNNYCSLLLTGDISIKIEQNLAAPKQPLTWLLAAHHGSASSSSLEFLKNWKPQHIIYSAGFLNQFNHPAQRVQARVNALAIKPHLTARLGAIHLRAKADGSCVIENWRQMRRRFWSAPYYVKVEP